MSQPQRSTQWNHLQTDDDIVVERASCSLKFPEGFPLDVCVGGDDGEKGFKELLEKIKEHCKGHKVHIASGKKNSKNQGHSRTIQCSWKDGPLCPWAIKVVQIWSKEDASVGWIVGIPRRKAVEYAEKQRAKNRGFEMMVDNVHTHELPKDGSHEEVGLVLDGQQESGNFEQLLDELVESREEQISDKDPGFIGEEAKCLGYNKDLCIRISTGWQKQTKAAWDARKKLHIDQWMEIYGPKVECGQRPLGDKACDKETIQEYLEDTFSKTFERCRENPRACMLVDGMRKVDGKPHELIAFRAMLFVKQGGSESFPDDDDSALSVIKHPDVERAMGLDQHKGVFIVLQAASKLDTTSDFLSVMRSAAVVTKGGTSIFSAVRRAVADDDRFAPPKEEVVCTVENKRGKQGAWVAFHVASNFACLPQEVRSRKRSEAAGGQVAEVNDGGEQQIGSQEKTGEDDAKEPAVSGEFEELFSLEELERDAGVMLFPPHGREVFKRLKQR